MTPAADFSGAADIHRGKPSILATSSRDRAALADARTGTRMSGGVAGPRLPHVRPQTLQTGTRLGLALLAYMLGVTLIITLLPFHFGWPSQWRVMLDFLPVDFVANILLFVPLGFFYRLARNADPPGPLQVFLLGGVLSGLIESAQLFELSRTTSPLDVAANATGAWLGALASRRVASSEKVGGRLVGWLALELPLMGLVYLLVPLLWVSSLSWNGGVTRAAAALLLGVFGANLLGGMQRYYFGPARASTARRTAAFAGLWFVAGAFPSLPSRPLGLALSVAAVAAVAWWLGRAPAAGTASNRRFEVPLLQSSMPVFAAYLALIAVAPLADGVGEWSLRPGFSAATADQVEILRLLEVVAAFTLVGYMVAEFGGRLCPHYRAALARLLRWSAALACILEGIRGFHPEGASLARMSLVIAAALYGGWLYYLQRAHVVQLLSTDKPQTGPG